MRAEYPRDDAALLEAPHPPQARRTAVISAGVAPLVDAVPAALVALTLVGGAYLLHLGVATLRSTRTVGAPNLSPTSDAVSPTPVSPTTAGHGFLRRGIAVSALNPKSLLFFLAFLPQFTRQSAPWPMPVQLLVLGVVWVVLAGLVYAAMGFTVQRTLAQRPHLQRGVALVAGVAMILAGVGLLGEQLVHTLTAVA
jgi:threonine/homoserine/homoserine lactone efflux protein